AAPGEALGRIFRTLHTIKGSCSFLGFPHLEAVAHAGENLLGGLRDGKLALSPVVTEALLRVVDAIRRMLGSIENAGNDGNTEYRDLIDLLNRLASDQTVAGALMARGRPSDLVPSPSQLDFSLAEEVAIPSPLSPTGERESTAPLSPVGERGEGYSEAPST